MGKNYVSEIEGQKEFYERININPDLHHDTDGIDRGNLYENKLNIDNINKVLFQAIKYASRIRIRGEKLPSNIILNDLNAEKAYIYKSKDLLSDIEKVYLGAASKNNELYTTDAKRILVDYSTPSGLQTLLEYVQNDNFTKYHINRDNIYGLSRVFYKTNQNKDAFLKGENAEIRKPTIINDRVIPYNKPNNLEFKEIMDCLNPNLLQREQGAYYTPVAYVKEMQKMLLQAIQEVPQGYDYLIIDRCAGVGNLEEGLSDEILQHCILSTIEFNEYQILQYKFTGKSTIVIPATNALKYDVIPCEISADGLINDYIREKLNDDKCVVILLENPPFSEAGSGASQKTGRKTNSWKNSFIMQEMKKEIKGAATNELSNLFIWSGFKYYLRSPLDSYILYSPTKYWRNQNLVNKKFVNGFLCNRKEFHAGQNSAISCIWWKNIDDRQTEHLKLPPYNIENNKCVRAVPNDIDIKKAHILLSTQYDRRRFKNDCDNGIICEKNGTEFVKDGRKVAISKPIYNENIIGYMQTDSFSIDRKTVKLVRCALYNGHGFYLRSDNFLQKLPLFVASVFPYDKWYKTDVYSKSYDGNGKHLKDSEFLKKCLIYTSLTPKNKCMSFLGSDGRFYKNELCLADNTIAKKTLENYDLTKIEKKLLKYFDDVLYEIQDTDEYDENITYGYWQIKEQINIKIPSGIKDRYGEDKMIIKYPNLNTALLTLDNELKQYYEEYILDDLFKYELLK